MVGIPTRNSESDPSQAATVMSTTEDFRQKSHLLLLELDAATIGMMMLVSSKCVTGPDWDFATKRHHDAYEIWNSFLNEPPAL